MKRGASSKVLVLLVLVGLVSALFPVSVAKAAGGGVEYFAGASYHVEFLDSARSKGIYVSNDGVTCLRQGDWTYINGGCEVYDRQGRSLGYTTRNVSSTPPPVVPKTVGKARIYPYQLASSSLEWLGSQGTRGYPEGTLAGDLSGLRTGLYTAVDILMNDYVQIAFSVFMSNPAGAMVGVFSIVSSFYGYDVNGLMVSTAKALVSLVLDFLAGILPGLVSGSSGGSYQPSSAKCVPSDNWSGTITAVNASKGRIAQSEIYLDSSGKPACSTMGASPFCYFKAWDRTRAVNGKTFGWMWFKDVDGICVRF